MDGIERRKIIERNLRESKFPIKGQYFAKKLGVSRQVIVQDIAILRAEGLNLIGTPSGYKMEKESSGIIKRITTLHHTHDEMSKELGVFIKHGARILDTIVEHEIYGEIRANLHIKTSDELKDFVKKSEGIEPLSKITSGVHLHTIEVDKEEDYENIIKDLKAMNLLITD